MGDDGRIGELIEAGVQAGCYWRKERLATHPSAKKAWAGMALARRAVGAAICGEICADLGRIGQGSVAMSDHPKR